MNVCFSRGQSKLHVLQRAWTKLSSEGKMEWRIPICLDITYTVMSRDPLKHKKKGM